MRAVTLDWRLDSHPFEKKPSGLRIPEKAAEPRKVEVKKSLILD